MLTKLRNVVTDLVVKAVGVVVKQRVEAAAVEGLLEQERRVWKAHHKAYKAQRDRDFQELQDKNQVVAREVDLLNSMLDKIEDYRDALSITLERLRTAASPEGFDGSTVWGWVDDEYDGLRAERAARIQSNAEELRRLAVTQGVINEGVELSEVEAFILALGGDPSEMMET